MARVSAWLREVWQDGAANVRARRAVRYARTELDRLDYAGSAPGVRNFYAAPSV